MTKNSSTTLWNTCQLWYSIFCRYNRIAELQRLEKWAATKKFTKVEKWYHNLYVDETLRLHRYTLNSPQLTRYAGYLYLVSSILVSVPRYIPSGSAKRYSRKA